MESINELTGLNLGHLVSGTGPLSRGAVRIWDLLRLAQAAKTYLGLHSHELRFT